MNAPITWRAQRSSRLDTSAPEATGAVNVEPSRRVTTASATWAGLWTLGGGAGSSMRLAASWMTASTTEPITSRVTTRASCLVLGRAVTAPGIAAVRRSTTPSGTKAGTHLTAISRVRPSERLWAGRVGTTDPRATSRTAAIAARPSQATLAPTPSRPRPPPTATSQPRASPTGMDSAAARSPEGSGTAG